MPLTSVDHTFCIFTRKNTFWPMVCDALSQTARMLNLTSKFLNVGIFYKEIKSRSLKAENFYMLLMKFNTTAFLKFEPRHHLTIILKINK